MTAATYDVRDRQALRDLGVERQVTHLVDIDQLSLRDFGGGQP